MADNNKGEARAMRGPGPGRGPGGPGMRGRPMKTENAGKTLVRILKYITARYKFRFILVLVCIVLSACTSAVSSLFLKTLIDDYISPLLLEAEPVFSGLLKAICVMGVIYLVGIASSFTYNRLMVVITQGVMRDVRDGMFDHMQTLPVRYFDTHTHGDIMSHYTNDTDTLRQMISQSIPQMCSSAITIVVVFVSMVSMSPLMTLAVMLFVVLMLFVTAKIGGNSAKYFVRQQKALGDLNGFIEERINGQKVVKVFCYEEKTRREFDEKNDELCRNAASANKFANILMPVMTNLGHIQYIVLAIVGGALAIGGVGGLTLGGIVSFLQLSKNFNMPINQLSQQMNSIIMALAGAERIFKLMDEEPETDDGYVTLVNAEEKDGALTESAARTGIWAWKVPQEDGSVKYTRLMGDVRFDNVYFGYTAERTILHDINIFAEPGQKVAFVGATGAGKTTITNLINRFYDIDSGTILYDGINISNIKKSDLRRSLGIVLQDVNLFTGTVWENLRYGRLDATDEEVLAAARLANADSFIKLLPQGYDTVLSGDGSGLSQGQRQLLAIARAAVADPPVMILDEATSSIDTRTETIVQRGMDSLMHGRTVFVIAHRLSTVQNSDVIMVLDMGRIIERGGHDKLVAEKGKYYSLYTGAFELD